MTIQQEINRTALEVELLAQGWTYDVFAFGGWVHDDHRDDDGKLLVFDSAEDVASHYGIEA